MDDEIPLIAQAISGSVASAASLALTYPVDRIRVALQVGAGKDSSRSTLDEAKSIYRNGGINGFYQGLVPSIQTTAIASLIYFYFFEAIKGKFPIGPIGSLFASLIAGILNMACTEPLWKASVQIQARRNKPRTETQNSQLSAKEKGEKLGSTLCTEPTSEVQRKNSTSSSGSWQEITSKDKNETEEKGTLTAPIVDPETNNLFVKVSQMMKKDGVLSMWSGFATSIWLTSNPVIQFFTYDWMKMIITRGRRSKILSSAEAFFLGMISKSIATVFTYPLQVAQTQMRSQGCEIERRMSQTKRMSRTMRNIKEKDGISGLFNGLGPKLGQASLTAAFLFLFHETMLKFISRRINQLQALKK